MINKMPDSNNGGSPDDFVHFRLADLKRKLGNEPSSYHSFIEKPSLKAGLYYLEKGTSDPQQPHELDEIYYIISGRSGFVAGNESKEVRPGDILYVRAHLEHKFVDIEEDLVVLVFFSAFKR